jgi:ribosomal protein L11 methylase PrmA
VRLKSGLRIAISPLFPWESRYEDVLKISSTRAFNPDHITTRLCLDLLDTDLIGFKCRSLLDVGCGSGILALAGAQLGSPMVVGLDIDLRAIRQSIRNADANGLNQKCVWLVGTTAAVKGRFDCICANLPGHVLGDNLGDFLRLLNPGGRLILSGFQDIDWGWLSGEVGRLGFALSRMLSGDRSFYGIPPSGSFTWMAVLLTLQELIRE